MELAEIEYLEACLLEGLAPSRFFQAFAPVDETSRKGPARRRILSFYQDDTFSSLDYNIHGWQGIAKNPYHMTAGRAFFRGGSHFKPRTLP